MDSVQQQFQDVRDQAAAAIDYVLEDLRQKWKEINGGPSVTEGIQRFIAAVDWSERWIQGLLATHLLLLILVIVLRRNSYVQASVFIGVMPVVYFAERINRLAAQNWSKFAKHNYFDPQGIFVSAMLSAPLLLVMFAILVNYLVSTSVLLVRMKRRELEYRARQRRRAEAGSSQLAGKQQQQAAGAAGSGAPAAAPAAPEAKKER